MKNLFCCLIAVIIIAFSLSSPVQAQSNVCVSDYKKYCQDVRPGGGRILNCLNRYAAKLTDACRASVAGLLACGRDQKKFCDGVSPENWQLQICMERHSADLAPDCAKTVNYFKKIRKS